MHMAKAFRISSIVDIKVLVSLHDRFTVIYMGYYLHPFRNTINYVQIDLKNRVMHPKAVQSEVHVP